METLFDIQTLSAVGVTEVCMKLPHGWRMMQRLRQEALRRNTQVAILIDAPIFNLPLAQRLKAAGLHVLYYISPQIWAWRQGRVKKIARRVDKMLTLFPFEVPFYTAAGIDAEYVGHPLIDRLSQHPSRQQAVAMLGLTQHRPTVALLPGSRRHEVKRLLPPMLEALRYIQQRIPQVQSVLPVANTLPFDDVQHMTRSVPLNVKTLQGQSTTALCAADFAIVASGTATLEAGFIGTPMVVVYKAHPLTAWVAKRLIRIPSIGLVNIVAGRQVVPELLQHEAQPHNIAACALQSLQNRGVAQRIRADLRVVRHRLGAGGSTQRAAACVTRFIDQTRQLSSCPSHETKA
jgi:lipid-A-disaccharide synthase